jgi:hypothetical protein
MKPKYLIALILCLCLLANHTGVQADPLVDACNAVTDVPLTECHALVTLYNATNGAGWNNRSLWLTPASADNWYGITVSGGHVTQIMLALNNLSGTIPTDLAN